MNVTTRHWKDEHGEQVTERIVEQGAVEYRFRIGPDGYEYLGDGEPADGVREALPEIDADPDGGAEA